MAKYKVCPVCGAQNSPVDMECASCGSDITTVSVIDSEVKQQPTPEPAATEPEQPQPKMVRICSCGEINPAQARKCQRCGEDISDVVPIPEQVQIESRYQLSAIGEDYIFAVPCGTMVIGREHEMREWLGDKIFVSRAHAKLVSEGGALFVENLSTTNYTYVNNVRIPDGRVKLNVGDELALGGKVIDGNRQKGAAYFVVGTMP